MPIQKEDLDSLNGETTIKKEMVFMERSFTPSSVIGDGIDKGFLMLTNMRLFFFSQGNGKSKGSLILRQAPGILASTIAGQLGGEIAGKVVEFAESGIEYLIEKSEYSEELNPFLRNESSFVVPINKIINCEKFGNYLGYMAGFAASKTRYVRITIEDPIGTIKNYCIYSIDPKDPLRKAIKYSKWFDEISNLRRNIFCTNCGEKNSLRENFCTSCGFAIRKS